MTPVANVAPLPRADAIDLQRHRRTRAPDLACARPVAGADRPSTASTATGPMRAIARRARYAGWDFTHLPDWLMAD
jgi:hypothetical protein